MPGSEEHSPECSGELSVTITIQLWVLVSVKFLHLITVEEWLLLTEHGGVGNPKAFPDSSNLQNISTGLYQFTRCPTKQAHFVFYKLSSS